MLIPEEVAEGEEELAGTTKVVVEDVGAVVEVDTLLPDAGGRRTVELVPLELGLVLTLELRADVAVLAMDDAEENPRADASDC